MIISLLMGGLGNQMFQYAAGRAASLHYGTALKLDTSFLDRQQALKPETVLREYDLDIFNINATIATEEEIKRLKGADALHRFPGRLLQKWFGVNRKYLKQPYFHFYPELFKRGGDLYIEGYWQSEKFFQPFETTIREDFTFKEALSNKSQMLARDIYGCNAVCVNVRRGDFVTNPLHGAMDTSYYSKGSGIIESKISDPHYFVFSDDMAWCREHLSFNGPTTFVGHEYAGKKFGEYLQLMIACKHFIIPNSSFAWWAAWLNTRPEKIVVTPVKWFNEGPQDTQDLIPSGWLRI